MMKGGYYQPTSDSDTAQSRGISMHIEMLPTSASRLSFMRMPPGGDARHMFSGYSSWPVASCVGGDDTAAAIVMNSQEKLRDYSSKRLGKDQNASLAGAGTVLTDLIDGQSSTSALHTGTGTEGSSLTPEVLYDAAQLLTSVEMTHPPPTSYASLPSVPPGVGYATSVGRWLSQDGHGSEGLTHPARLEFLPPLPAPPPSTTSMGIADMSPTDEASLSAVREVAASEVLTTSSTLFRPAASLPEGNRRSSGQPVFHESLEALLTTDDISDDDAHVDPINSDADSADLLAKPLTAYGDDDASLPAPSHARQSWAAAMVGWKPPSYEESKSVSIRTDDVLDDAFLDSLVDKSSPGVMPDLASGAEVMGRPGASRDSSHLQWASTQPLSDAEFEALR